ncbi:cysteine-rich CWC family protein [Oxalicibacterium flavum]|uniref:cysteine-rich CWC family protein n=1 Tax=Oxalicibacterium flavum TaxID=179467 RepID=UPI0035312ECA
MVLPWNLRMYGSASARISALLCGEIPVGSTVDSVMSGPENRCSRFYRECRFFSVPLRKFPMDRAPLLRKRDTLQSRPFPLRMSTCPQCQTRFDCGVADTGAPAACWCMRRPRDAEGKSSKEVSKGTRCLCPQCLDILRARRRQGADG